MIYQKIKITSLVMLASKYTLFWSIIKMDTAKFFIRKRPKKTSVLSNSFERLSWKMISSKIFHLNKLEKLWTTWRRRKLLLVLTSSKKETQGAISTSQQKEIMKLSRKEKYLVN